MKRILSLLLIVMLVFTACSQKTPEKTEEELRAEIKAEMEEELKNEPKDEIPKENLSMIKNDEELINFINTTETNFMVDDEGEKLKVADDYEICYFDFTGEGNDDAAIVSFLPENQYRPIFFVTTDIIEGEYSLINSDFRAGKNKKEFESSGDFIIQKDLENNTFDIAYKFQLEDEPGFITMLERYIGYGKTEYKHFDVDTSEVIENTLTKIDGYNEFVVDSKGYYLDSTGEKHLLNDFTTTYKFNMDNVAFETKQVQNMEANDLNPIIEKELSGNDTSLKSFDTIYKENGFKDAISYYKENRLGFTKEARISYINDVNSTINKINMYQEYGGLYPNHEIIDNKLYVYINMDNPIPEDLRDIFKVVKMFYIEDGAEPQNFEDALSSYNNYDIICVNPEISKNLRLMAYDMRYMSDEYYFDPSNNNAITIFESQEQMLNDIKNVVYPGILINDFSELKYFEHDDVWKANISLIPDEVSFEIIDEGGYEED